VLTLLIPLVLTVITAAAVAAVLVRSAGWCATVELLAICKAMAAEQITPDFIVVDGSEGGTGAAPLEYEDHVGTPLSDGLIMLHNALVGTGRSCTRPC
jgi:glutamate synthase domain-containing protein 2